MEDATAPAGLFLSLDQLIKKNTQGRQQKGGRGGNAGGTQAGGRGGFGRKGRGFAVSGGVAKASGGGGGRGRRPGGGQQGGRGRGRQRVSDPTAYRRYQQCYMDEATGDVVVIYHETTIVRITPQGDVTLNSGGFHTETTLNSFNDAMGPIGVKVSAPEAGHPADSQWLVSDGRSLFRFTDGMTLVSKGPQHAARGPLVLQGFQNPDAAVASAASNAAAAAVGILPKNAPGVPLELGNPRRSWARGGASGGAAGGGDFGGGFGGGGGFAGGGRFGGGGGRGLGRGRAAGGGRTYVRGHMMTGQRQQQQPQRQQQQQWQQQEQNMDYGGGFEDPQFEEAEQNMDDDVQWDDFEPPRQYGSSGMRADGYDPDDMPGDTRNDAARTRSRLRAQGRL